MRVLAYIDGLNLYHGIRMLGRPRYKWCDAKGIAARFLGNAESLQDVKYYTASPRHCAQDIIRRRGIYMKALRATRVKVTIGNFRRKTRHVPKLLDPNGEMIRLEKGHAIQVHEETETDVCIAVDMIDDLHLGVGEKMILVSGDSDFLPAVRRLLDRGMKVLILAPSHQKVRGYRALARKDPRNISVREIKSGDIEACLLPERMEDGGGGIIRMPQEYSSAIP